MSIIELNKNNFDTTINDNDIVIIDFWASWCKPCNQFAPTYEEASNKIDGVIFAKINTEDEDELATKFNIRSIPTLMIFRDKVEVFSKSGVLSADDLASILNKAKNLNMDKVHAEIAEKNKNP